MLSNVTISNRQMMIITALFCIGTTILVAPSTLAADAKQDAWICAILGNVVGYGLAWLYIAVGLLYPNQNLLEINERVLGKWLGWAVSLLFLFTMLLASSQVLFYIGNFLITHMFPETPIIALHILFLLVVMLAMRLGLEAFARCIELFTPLLLLLFCSLIFFLCSNMEFENVQPILEASGNGIMRGTMSFVSMVQVFRLRTYKPLILPKAFLVVVFSLIVYPNTAYMNQWDVDAWLPYSLIFGLFYPLLLLIVGLIRKKRGRDSS
ncbi:GerAB/ArcD/ProY family transporter [Brevibacillus agri]|uniref:GerAB/ArcD/ProY family transporter n=1 Tax=Brevibacillus agri TaxID=51101 RepID=UPI003D261271